MARTPRRYITGYTPQVRGTMGILLSHLSRYVGKTSEQIYEDFTGDYGSMSKRVVLRYLSTLIQMGCVRRDDEAEFDFELGQLRPVYFLVKREIPRISRRRPEPYKVDRICPHCGMWGTSARTHPRHESAVRAGRTYLNRYYAGGASAQRPALSAESPPGRTIAEMSTTPQPGAVIG